MYKQMVFPLLEYCASIWDPHHQSAIQKLEMVQLQAASFVTNKPWSHNDNDTITTILCDLKWLSLQSHRKYLIKTHVIILNHQPPPTDPSSISFTTSKTYMH